MSDLPKAYDPSLVEEKWQSLWIEEGCFKADPASEKPAYSVVIPPPNVTGVLHLGHVLNNTIQDILCAARGRRDMKPCGFPERTMRHRHAGARGKGPQADHVPDPP